MYTCIRVYTYTCVRIYIYPCISVYIYILKYLYLKYTLLNRIQGCQRLAAFFYALIRCKNNFKRIKLCLEVIGISDGF